MSVQSPKPSGESGAGGGGGIQSLLWPPVTKKEHDQGPSAGLLTVTLLGSKAGSLGGSGAAGAAGAGLAASFLGSGFLGAMAMGGHLRMSWDDGWRQEGSSAEEQKASWAPRAYILSCESPSSEGWAMATGVYYKRKELQKSNLPPSPLNNCPLSSLQRRSHPDRHPLVSQGFSGDTWGGKGLELRHRKDAFHRPNSNSFAAQPAGPPIPRGDKVSFYRQAYKCKCRRFLLCSGVARQHFPSGIVDCKSLDLQKWCFVFLNPG